MGFTYRSVLFEGTNEYASFGDVLGFERTSPFSYSFWVRFSASSTQMMMSKATGSTTYRGVHVYGSNGALIFMLCSDAATNNRIQIQTTSLFNDGVWHHVAVTSDGSSTAAGCKIYVDNVLQAVTVIHDALSATILTTGAFVLGSRSSLDTFFTGRLDEVAVYSKELSALEVAWVYNGIGIPRDLCSAGAPSGLEAWWRMGEWDTPANLVLLDSGPGAVYPMVRDLSGYPNHGTMSNMESGDIVTDAPGGGAFATKSLLFDGVDESVNVWNALNYDRNQAFSISAWVKSTGTSGAIAARWTGASGPPAGWSLFIGANELSFGMVHTWATNAFYVSASAPGVNNGSWHHVVMTFSGNNSATGVKFYLDEVLLTNNAPSFDNLVSSILISFDTRLGKTQDSHPYIGNLDEVAGYNRVLTGAEVSWLRNGGVPRSLKDVGAPPNLVGWWRLGEGAYQGSLVNMESTDFGDDTIMGLPASLLARGAYYSGDVGSVLDGNCYVLGDGAGGPVAYYKMRAQDSGASPPGYITWVVADAPDFAGAGYSSGTPTPVGAMVAGSVVVAAQWEEAAP